MGGISLKFATSETRRESGIKIHTSRSKSSKTIWEGRLTRTVLKMDCFETSRGPSLLQEVFLRVFRLSHLLKNQQSKL